MYDKGGKKENKLWSPLDYVLLINKDLISNWFSIENNCFNLAFQPSRFIERYVYTIAYLMTGVL